MARRSRATAISRQRALDGLNSSLPSMTRTATARIFAASVSRSRRRAEIVPYRVAFSPDGKRLAVGYIDVAAVDILDGTTLKRLGGQARPTSKPRRDCTVAWSGDGQTLFAAGGVVDTKKRRSSFSRGIAEGSATNGA